MKILKVNGNKYIKGKVLINGSKNSALPIIAASILNKGKVCLYDIPEISDVLDMLTILDLLNVRYEYENNILKIDSSNITYENLISNNVKKIRASYYFIGSMLSVFNKVSINTPGGCSIGKRPIDYHIKVMEEMGGEYSFYKDALNIEIKKYNKLTFRFKKKSVGATINAILASVGSNEAIVLKNVAKEPEVIDVINFLNIMGCNIIIRNNKYICKKHKKLKSDVSYRIIPDRIEAATYITLGLLAGEVVVENVNLKHMKSFLKPLIKNNANIITDKNKVLAFKSRVNSFDIFVSEYPKFPTDIQPIIMVLLALSNDLGLVKDSIFEQRFNACHMLNKMKANIDIKENYVVYKGVKSLKGAVVEATDLRAAAALVLAGVVAKGSTYIKNIEYIERGYADVYNTLTRLGADLCFVEEVDEENL